MPKESAILFCDIKNKNNNKRLSIAIAFFSTITGQKLPSVYQIQIKCIILFSS